MNSKALLDKPGNRNSFPIDYYLRSIVRILDTTKYNDQNYTTQERRDKLHYVYTKAAKHFAQPKQQRFIKDMKMVQAAVETSCKFVVYTLVNLPYEVAADFTTLIAHCIVFDDENDNPSESMKKCFNNMQAGRPQDNEWLRMINEQALPECLAHYNSYCAFIIYRSILDFFQGCWIEHHKFLGYPGLYDYPVFLRRLNGLGQLCSAALFPKDQFDEESLFREITATISQMEHWILFVNDIFSAYKEFNDDCDEMNLLRCYAKCDETTVEEALEKLTKNVILKSEQLMHVFHDKDSRVFDSVKKYLHGYMTFYLTEPRYRLHEVSALAADQTLDGVFKFLDYYNHAQEVDIVDRSDWAYPTVLECKADQKSL